MISIDKEKHPIPEPGDPYQRYPFAYMEVGQSFTVTYTDREQPLGRRANSLRTSAKKWAEREECAYEFIVRKVSETEIRCWRVA